MATNFSQCPINIKHKSIALTPVDEIEKEINLGYNFAQNETLSQLQLENIQTNLKVDHLNLEEQKALQALLINYKHLFHIEGQKLTFTHKIKHKFNMKSNNPVYVRNYRQPIETKKEIKKQTLDLLRQDIVKQSVLPWNAPVHIVTTHKDGRTKNRMVVDFRRLNEQMIEDKYPIPNIADILDKLGRANYFSSLDLASGFHQIEMDPKDSEKTAFSTEQGHFEFKRMPFGLKNAPATFQRIMDEVLRGLFEDTCLVYLDDIIIYSSSLQEHLQKLIKVFKRLESANFKIKLEKCEFLKREIKYLGHIITDQGVKPNPEKIEAVSKFPIPKTRTEIKGFLGLLGYYRKFIKDFAKITKPFTLCLKKNAKINIQDPNYVSAFQQCKQLLTNDPILQYPDFSREFIVTTDASDIALGAVLSQGTVGRDKPICYASRTLSDTESKYNATEKELLAIVYACKQFRPYIYGKKFTIFTDHRPLQWLWSLKEPNSKLIRWRTKLEEFDFDVVYKKGKQNTNADALSRIRLTDLNVITQSDLDSILPQFDDEELLEIAQEMSIAITEPTTSHVPPYVGQGIGRKDIKLTDTPVKKADAIRKKHIQMDEDEISNSDTIHTTQTQQPQKSIEIQDTILDNKKKQFILSTSLGNELEVKIKTRDDCTIHLIRIPSENSYTHILNLIKTYMTGNKTFYIFTSDEDIYKKMCTVYTGEISNKGPRIIRCLRRAEVITVEEKKVALVVSYHTGITNHRGIQETLAHLKQKYWWPRMENTITNVIKSCDTCNRAKYNRRPDVPLLPITETPEAPFEKLFVDLFSFANNKYLTIIDSFTRLGHALKVKSKNPSDMVDAFLTYFNFYGIPHEIRSDQGSEFNNKLLKELASLHRITLHFGTAKNPESQANIERFHSTLLEHLRCLDDDPDISKDEMVRSATIAYNNTINSAIGMTPFEALFGHTKSRNPMDLFYDIPTYQNLVDKHKSRMAIMYEGIKNKDQERKKKTQEKQQESVRTTIWKPGEKVYVENITKSNKMMKPYFGPYVIIKVNDNNTVDVQTRRGIQTYHTRRLKHGIVPDANGSTPTSE